jgi:hypothetical protein
VLLTDWVSEFGRRSARAAPRLPVARRGFGAEAMQAACRWWGPPRRHPDRRRRRPPRRPPTTRPPWPQPWLATTDTGGGTSWPPGGPSGSWSSADAFIASTVTAMDGRRDHRAVAASAPPASSPGWCRSSIPPI